MAKKSFKEKNPALQFISATEAPESADAQSAAQIDSGDAAEFRAPDFGAERKSKRLNLLIQPSVVAKLGKIAHMQKTSVNDLINRVMKEYCETQSESIAMYDEVFGQ